MVSINMTVFHGVNYYDRVCHGVNYYDRICHGVNKYDRVFLDVNKHDRDCLGTDSYTEIYWFILNSTNTLVVYTVTAQY